LRARREAENAIHDERALCFLRARALRGKIQYMRTLFVLSAVSLLLSVLCPKLVGAAEPSDAKLRLRATIVHLPESPTCEGKIYRVTTLYRVEEVLHGSYSGKTILVVHRCPRMPRGESRYGRGDAHRMRAGHSHLLQLQPASDGSDRIDPFDADRRPRYRPVRTDMAPEPPRIVVVVKGGAGASYKVGFDAYELQVGRAVDADIRLSAPSVGEHHLGLRVQGDRIQIRALDNRRVLLNEKPLPQPELITYQDHIRVGIYTLRIALFLDD
jgi:hypothetical protein